MKTPFEFLQYIIDNTIKNFNDSIMYDNQPKPVIKDLEYIFQVHISIVYSKDELYKIVINENKINRLSLYNNDEELIYDITGNMEFIRSMIIKTDNLKFPMLLQMETINL